ncbi:hypothetical protein [Endozoicomonas lisbonensis]|uniref:Uncharacterized protein n=1 Tax=Endozoicomonas lisbonensis TaxID=3120522 RepID=A0ABV2SLC7_9GAMM
MSNLKLYNKRRKQLAAEIKQTKALLASQKKALKSLRETHQHEAVDHLEDYLQASDPDRVSLISLIKKWFKK